jgi:hypothetical protein
MCRKCETYHIFVPANNLTSESKRETERKGKYAIAPVVAKSLVESNTNNLIPLIQHDNAYLVSLVTLVGNPLLRILLLTRLRLMKQISKRPVAPEFLPLNT